MRIGNHFIDKDKLFFIVEEGNANDGDINKAFDMIDLAAKSGADAIEFQLAIASDFYVENDLGFKRYKNREFSNSQIKQLVDRASKYGMEFIVAALSHNLIEPIVEAGCSAITINASDINNPAILDSASKSALPILLSTMLASEDEIKWAINRLTQHGTTDIILLHGQHAMASTGEPLSVNDTSLGYINTLRNKYNLPVGFTDHTPFKWMPASAVAAGACIITKHLISSRKDKTPDWFICLEPEEMESAIKNSKMIYSSVIDKEKTLLKAECDDKLIMRRSIVASKALKINHVLKYGDLSFKRPGTGLEPSSYNKLIGKRLKRNLDYDEQIKLSDLEN